MSLVNVILDLTELLGSIGPSVMVGPVSRYIASQGQERKSGEFIALSEVSADARIEDDPACITWVHDITVEIYVERGIRGRVDEATERARVLVDTCLNRIAGAELENGGTVLIQSIERSQDTDGNMALFTIRINVREFEDYRTCL